MNQPSEKRKLLDEVLGESASKESAANESPGNLPNFLSAAVRERRRRRVQQRVAAVAGVSLALVGLGLIALHRTRHPANKDMAQARIHEAVTSAPKVRTRKFQAAVVKTKDHAPLPKVVPHAQPTAEMVVTEKLTPNVSDESSFQVVDTQSPVAGELVFIDTNGSLAGELSYVSTERGGYGLLDDDALLASLAPRAMMLIRDGAEREHLVFLNPRDEKGFYSD